MSGMNEADAKVARELQMAAEFLEGAVQAARHDEKLAGEITAHANGVDFIIETLAPIQNGQAPPKRAVAQRRRDPARV